MPGSRRVLAPGRTSCGGTVPARDDPAETSAQIGGRVRSASAGTTTGDSGTTSGPWRVASQQPARTRAKPPSVVAVISSSRKIAPTATATAGLMNVMSVARAGPTAAIRRKKTTNAIAVHRMPRATTASTASAGGVSSGQVDQRDRGVDDRHRAERHGDDADIGDVREPADGDERRRRVADAHEQDLDDAPPRRLAAEVGGDEQRHAAEPEGDAGEPPRRQRVAVAEQVGDDRADDRHARDEQAGEAGRKVALGVGEQEPGDRHLQRGERQQRPPARERGADRAGTGGDDQQRDDGDRRAAEHDDRWGHVLDGDLDEQVRHAPDGAHQPEQDPGAPVHRPPGAQRTHCVSARRLRAPEDATAHRPNADRHVTGLLAHEEWVRAAPG